jgi:signal transduction histidine kinase/ActR/RegA family two-component response regulator
MRHKDGHWIYIESTASVVHDSHGKLQQMVIVNRDIGERRRLEQQLHQSQKMDAIGRLSGGVAHDFNNLLGVIIGYGEILEERIPETDELRASVDQILKAGRRASSLTRQLLAFSRQQVLEPKVLVLNSVVSDMQKMLHRLVGEDMELAIDLEPDLGATRSDQNQIEQVIMNLVVNARDAMPDGGRVLIQTSNFHIDEEFAARYAYPVVTGDYVLLTVSDSGEGMDLATQQRIFEPFFTTKEQGKGTGLGLSMVFGFVKQTGGGIEVLSEQGHGATFRIYLPKAEGGAPRLADHDDLPVRGGNETILCVEDDAGIRDYVAGQLVSLGYTVHVAANADDALAIVARGTAFDLLFTDIVMPGCMNGRQLAETLMAGRPTLRVLFTSGYSDGALPLQGRAGHGIPLLRKPYRRAELARTLRRCLDLAVDLEGDPVPLPYSVQPDLERFLRDNPPDWT